MTDEQLRSISDAELLRVAGHAMIDEAQAFAPLKIMLDYETCWHLIGMLQLALRNPSVTGTHPAEAARLFIQGLADHVATSPATREMVRRGWEQSQPYQPGGR